ncbi:hypothetical protein [Sinorhizobium saheli]|uniref:hypothetical protein n=1 Tax=Sinorhizobium saheli TaxID=36856 RepID=UPI001428C242|nr:hypothetical protein [Sinorhizobium saheli]
MAAFQHLFLFSGMFALDGLLLGTESGMATAVLKSDEFPHRRLPSFLKPCIAQSVSELLRDCFSRVAERAHKIPGAFCSPAETPDVAEMQQEQTGRAVAQTHVRAFRSRPSVRAPCSPIGPAYRLSG